MSETVAYFGHDRSESTTRKRVEMIAAAGVDATALLFDRGTGAPKPVAAARDVDLGRTADAAHGQRLVALGRAFVRARRAARGADVLWARNLDMLLLALAVRLSRPGARPRVVYECLDIHRALVGRGVAARALRWIERRALALVDRLVLSSPAFLDVHFAGRQGWRGPTTLIENKIYAPGRLPPRPVAPTASASGPLVIVWPGMLRCRDSLLILRQAAIALGDGVQVRLHGKVQPHAIPDFDALATGLPNLVYHGPFTFPDGLAEVYRGAHLVWAQDLWRRGGNSDWLLPNRLYEGGYFGAPAVAVSGTETARLVAARGLGRVLPEASVTALVTLLEGWPRAEILAAQAELLARPASGFALDTADARALVAEILRHEPRPHRGVNLRGLLSARPGR